jgi:hypothetical protein
LRILLKRKGQYNLTFPSFISQICQTDNIKLRFYKNFFSMSSTTMKIVRLSVWIALTLVLAGIVIYPKIKPFLRSDVNNGPPSGGMGMRGGSAQPLYASGYVIVPTDE